MTQTKIELIQSLQDQMNAVEFEERERLDLILPLMTMLRDYCKIVSFEWYVYTPSFNDGDPCEMTCSDYARVVFDDDEERDEDEEREEYYIPSIPDHFHHLTLDAEIKDQIQAAAKTYHGHINLLMNVGKFETDTRFIYTWEDGVLTEGLEEYYGY